jgi:hypothetical protein
MSPYNAYICDLHCKSRISTTGNCTILRHNQHLNFYRSVNIWRVILGNFLNYKTTEPWQKLWTYWIRKIYHFKTLCCINFYFDSTRGFGLVVRAAGWHAGDPGSILGRDSLYTFGCIPPAPWAFLGWICALYKSYFFILSFFYAVEGPFQVPVHPSSSLLTLHMCGVAKSCSISTQSGLIVARGCKALGCPYRNCQICFLGCPLKVQWQLPLFNVKQTVFESRK